MKFIILVVFMMMVPLEMAPLAGDADLEDAVYSIFGVPVTQSYIVYPEEFHDCVSCNSDDQARNDFYTCIGELSPESHKIMRNCCEITFGQEFCKDMFSGKVNYMSICDDPKKGLKVEHCFLGKQEDEDDIEIYVNCTKVIKEKYCTIPSFGDMAIIPLEDIFDSDEYYDEDEDLDY